MKVSWLQTARGMVTAQIRGARQEELVNAAAEAGIRLWSIRRTGGEEMYCDLSVSDFFRLRPLLRRTSCKIHVVGRQGFPFWLARVERRKFFAIGLFLFIAGLYALSSLVWEVEISGNHTISQEQIRQAAYEEGIYPMQWSFRLDEMDTLSRNLIRKLPGAAWVGIEKQGIKISIKVVESTIPGPKALYSPRHLVANTDAVVTEIIAEAGRPVVKRNSKVKKGQILISGTIGTDNNTSTVVAKGSVKGLVWHEYSIESPLERQVKVYTGNAKTKWHVVLGSRSLQVSGYGDNPFTSFESIERAEQASWRSLKLPVGRIKQTLMETRIDKHKLTVEEAKAAGLLQARADILSKAGTDAKIVDENLLHEKTENGKVYMKVFFEVEQSIMTEMPLVQMQGE
ncbi:sporulation protein YqfD [Paenibacillaceae bacterium]|nr:sporulation protein YqfD [Paenibacillaceae bacterium]